MAPFGSQAWAQTSNAAPTVKRGEPITLNFSNAEIEAVARTMAIMTGRNVVVDPRVKGTMTLVSDSPMSPARAYNHFLAVLRSMGYAVVQSDGLDKVVPEADAKLIGGGVSVNENGAPNTPGNQLVTQIIKLQFENANNLVAVLRPLINPNNPINVNPATNSLVITDYADNLRRLARIVAALDVPNATDVEIIPLKNASATDLAPLVLRLMESTAASPAGGTEAGFKTTVVAEPRSNALIVRAANQARLALAINLIDKLDQPVASVNGAAGNIYVVYLKNANATQLATTLRAAMGAGSGGSAPAATGAAPTAGAGASTLGAAQAPSTGGQIQADPTTNSLIITASEPQYRQLRAVIDKLDARRAQVFVESLIAEVSADKAAEFGIQWQGALGNAGDSSIGLLGTNFGAAGNNIISLATQGTSGTVAPGKGLNVGVASKTNGIYVLGFLARFLEATGSGNVLSTPNLLTLDNEEAKIVIGQNVPFVTGQFTNTGASTGSVNPFQTIERKDVGLTLKVKPQISENGTVKLTIFQEVSSVLASTVNAANGPTTNKRTIESNVLVEDGAVVVLGGLLQDEYAGSQERVPGLADVPFFGNLFKSEARSRKKTNLMVFLRPMVVRDATATQALSNERYEQMRGTQQSGQPEPSSTLPINEAPVLPNLQLKPGNLLLAPTQ
ncbi:type II secretion system secretin GspD [Rhodoferax sp. TBRC 17660]|uniref:Type II secretion system secretin GspD n=2 Tax=Rhodoferax potami TaxID=3068338 RepID=A0ABU3KKD3_9BURK|nr:type II secretion system secretin GspD [Rhodoferax sp. TBRC 17660]MDT7518246.1 type II secretion system secretin GspD [Rhodoferax sp. TBRC 17660]